MTRDRVDSPTADFEWEYEQAQMRCDVAWAAHALMMQMLSDLCVDCMDEAGNPVAPSKRELMRARQYLTKGFPGTLVKEKPA